LDALFSVAAASLLIASGGGSGVQGSGDARGDCLIGCPFPNSSIEQWRMVSLLLDIRCLWRHHMTQARNQEGRRGCEAPRKFFCPSGKMCWT